MRRRRAPWPAVRRAAGLAVLAATAFALAAIPVTLPVLSTRALARADRLENQGRVDEARVEADLAAALDRTSVDAQLERASLLQELGRPADARRAVDHALSLAPKDDRTWLTLAGYQRLCWHDRGWRKSLAARARAVGPRHRLRGLRRRGDRDQRRLHGGLRPLRCRG